MSDENRDNDIINEAHRVLDVAGVEPSGALLVVRIGYLVEQRDKLQAQVDALTAERSNLRERAGTAEQELQRYAERAEKAEKQVEIECDVLQDVGQRRRYVERLLGKVLDHGWPLGTTGPACVREARAWLRQGPESEAFGAWMREQGYELVEQPEVERARQEERARVDRMYEIPMQHVTRAVEELVRRGPALGLPPGMSIDECVTRLLDMAEKRDPTTTGNRS